MTTYVASDFSRTTEAIRLKPDPTYESVEDLSFSRAGQA